MYLQYWPNSKWMPWQSFFILNFGFGMVSDFLQYINPWVGIPALLTNMFSFFSLSLRYKLWQRLWFDFSDLTQKSNVWFWIPLHRWPVLVAQKTVQCLNHICAIFSFVLAPTQLTLRFWSWKSWPIWLHRVTLASFCGNFNLTSQVLVRSSFCTILPCFRLFINNKNFKATSQSKTAVRKFSKFCNFDKTFLALNIFFYIPFKIQVFSIAKFLPSFTGILR